MVAPVLGIEDALAAPDAETWRMMTATQRERFIERVHAALEDQRELMGKAVLIPAPSPGHWTCWTITFGGWGERCTSGRKCPCCIRASVSCNPMSSLCWTSKTPATTTSAWVVQDEGKGPEFALEVHYLGDEHKDFVRNVEDYARLGIGEYFICDRRRQSLVGYRLPPSAKSYERIHIRIGRFTSEVLGLDLQVRGGRLRFYSGDAELPDSEELIARIGGLVDDLTHRSDEALERAEQAWASAEQGQAQMLSDLRAVVFGILTARGMAIPEALRQHIDACTSSETLRDLAIRAGTADRAEAILDSRT